MNFGEAIKQARRKKELTRRQFAINLGRSVKTISKWETGETIPKINDMIEISECLDISLDNLVKMDSIVLKKILRRQKSNKVINYISFIGITLFGILVTIGLIIKLFM